MEPKKAASQVSPLTLTPSHTPTTTTTTRSYLERPDGAKIHYHLVGNGPQWILLLAPGGMQSQAAKWSNAPWNPLKRLVDCGHNNNNNDGDKTNNNNNNNKEEVQQQDLYTLIAMDQRYSWEGNIPEGLHIDWTTYRDDQIALLDHVQSERRRQQQQHSNDDDNNNNQTEQCHIVASCIGPCFGLQLIRDFPHRFAKAVWMQPIGISYATTEPIPWDGDNRDSEKEHWFGQWTQIMMNQGRCSNMNTLNRLHTNLFGPPHDDFCFSVTRDDLQRMNAFVAQQQEQQDQQQQQNSLYRHKFLVFCGRDLFHPAEIAREIGRLAPDLTVDVVEEWRDLGPEKLEQAHDTIVQFLQKKD